MWLWVLMIGLVTELRDGWVMPGVLCWVVDIGFCVGVDLF